MTDFIEEASKEFNMEPPLCEHTIRKCIEALPKRREVLEARSVMDGVHLGATLACHKALESLLPKPPATDRIESLWQDWCLETGGSSDPRDFARWLINEKGAL